MFFHSFEVFPVGSDLITKFFFSSRYRLVSVVCIRASSREMRKMGKKKNNSCEPALPPPYAATALKILNCFSNYRCLKTPTTRIEKYTIVLKVTLHSDRLADAREEQEGGGFICADGVSCSCSTVWCRVWLYGYGSALWCSFVPRYRRRLGFSFFLVYRRCFKVDLTDSSGLGSLVRYIFLIACLGEEVWRWQWW